MKTIKFLLVVLIISASKVSFGQNHRGGGHHHGNGHHRGGKVVVVKRSPYRPHRVVVYHPHWRPAYSYTRRWVYFPRHNMYWDNWRNHYVYLDKGVWISRPQAPAIILNVNLEREKNYELKTDEDDQDDVYNSNNSHRSQYKAD